MRLIRMTLVWALLWAAFALIPTTMAEASSTHPGKPKASHSLTKKPRKAYKHKTGYHIKKKVKK